MKSGENPISRRNFMKKSGQTLVAGSMLGASAATATAKTLQSDRKIRIGIVGGGFGSSFQWHQHPNCMVHAVSDLRDDRRNRLMKTYKCDRTYDSLEKLILDKEIEAVAVFTGAPDHVRHSVAVMNTGKHVICAVPAAMNLEECEQLLEAKKRNQRKYMMAETSYYNYHAIAARQLFSQGKFGELFYSEVEYYHPILGKEREYYWWRNGKPTWRHGYVPMLYPTHSTGYLVGVTRERLTEVSCLGWGDPNDTDLKDNQYHNPFNVQVALMKTDKGNVCRCNICYIGTARGERAQWFGTKLAYYMPGSGGQPFKIQGKDAPNWKEVPRFWERLPEFLRHETGHGGSHSFLTHEFIAALVEDREPAIDIYESLAMNAPGIVAHQSALKGGEQLKIPQYDDRIV